MRPTSFPEANVLLGVPPTHADRVEALPVATDGVTYVSRWEPTEAERTAIAGGAPVWLVVLATHHPPVGLTAGPDAGLVALSGAPS